MSMILSDMKLSEVILQHYVLMPVIRRFNIKLGFGEKTIKRVCEEYNLDTDLFLAVINLYIQQTYVMEHPLTVGQVAATVEYLQNTNNLIMQSQFPNVERHLRALMSNSFEHNKTIGVINNFFQEIKNELLAGIEYDNKQRFPYIERLCSGDPEAWTQKPADSPVKEPVDEKIFDLRSMLMKYLTGEADQNLCYAVFFALFTLENDIRQYNKICERLLNPAINNLEKNAER
jgi:regulator of cell morphogenesis and NO signaling